MAKRPTNGPPRVDNSQEINKLIAKFLEDVAKEFSQFSDMNAVNEPIIYGFNVRLGPDGQPIIGSFGNVKPSEPNVKYGEEREPLVDVIEKDKEITIIVEMPGAERNTIRIETHPNEVWITAKDHRRNFNTKVRVNHPLNPKARSVEFHNGVLELVFRRAASHGKPTVITIND